MSTHKRVLLLHGPNLQLLGRREPEIYGTTTLDQINEMLRARAADSAIDLIAFQSNHEGDLVDKIGEHFGNIDGVLINPAAYTHTSVAIRDALSALNVPVIEIHLSNVAARESFRHHSFVAPIAVGVIAGFGVNSYRLALDAMIGLLSDGSPH
ncbi:MAG: type II 3-dehydroquinate dehydratase [Candidatus Poribacteria bacterium]|nr:type II 3-dehydroquinate dehydratase [Candidatus Poribacteria bacterium]